MGRIDEIKARLAANGLLGVAIDPIVRRERIRSARLRQPIKELARKRDKAMRRSIWTQEDIDHAEAFAAVMLQKLNHNQCDGCKRGLQIIAGIHTEPNGQPYMFCSRNRYGIRRYPR